MRPLTTLLAGLVAAVALAACQKAPTGVTSDDMAMGNPKAKVTVIEYASVACPHCAAFNNDVFPAFKAKYIDTGRVRYVEREALTGDPAIAAAGFLTARCAGKNKYFQLVDAIYHGQEEMARTGDPHAVLLDIARSAGMTDAQFQECITDERALNALQARWNRYMTDDKITGTPTFVINGKLYANGEMTLPQLDAAVAQAQAGKASAS
ncbi:MAG: thioredoxin domain-containing protein [Caulobacteraceae bacterium]